MPRPGGESDKLGNRYEAIWTVGQLLDVAARKASAIVVEPLGEEGAGVEFVVIRNDGKRDFHSAKRQRSRGEWTISALTKRGTNGRSVLLDLVHRLAAPDAASCYFVSATGANDLRELSDLAKHRADLSTFNQDLNTESRKAVRRPFEKLVQASGLTSTETFAFLQRLEVRLADEKLLIRQVEQRVEHLVYKPDHSEFSPSDVRLLLADFYLGRLGAEIRPREVWEHLKSHGYRQRDWANDPEVVESIGAANRRFRDYARSELINRAVIPRVEASQIFAELTSGDGARAVLVTAPAGVGKSCVLAEVVDRLLDRQIPTLALRLDRYGESATPRDIGTAMTLPNSPVVALAGVANGSDCVLVIDQLDVASQQSGRYPRLWDAFEELQQEAANCPNMRLVVACRDFDVQHDRRIRRLRETIGIKQVRIPPLSRDEVRNVTTAVDSIPETLTERELDLLCTPLHLMLFLEAFSGEAPLARFSSIVDLYDRYWDFKMDAVRRRIGTSKGWMDVIDCLCDKMSEHLTLAVPEHLLDGLGEAAAAMKSEHVLAVDGGQVAFFHETFFDYAFARRFVGRSRKLIDLLVSSEQHLSRRGQVRQVLSYLRGAQDPSYREQLREILADGRVRFHVKRFVISWLSSLSDPTQEEWRLLESMIDDAELGRIAFGAICNSLPWFDLLNRMEVVREWLRGDDEKLIERGLCLLRYDCVSRDRSEEAAHLLAPHRGISERWTARLQMHFGFGSPHYSRAAQDLFLQLMADGVFDDEPRDGFGSWWMRLSRAADEAPEFALEAVCSWLDRRIAVGANAQRGDVIDRNDSDSSASTILHAVATHDPLAFAQAILPRVVQIVYSSWRSGERQQYDATWPHVSNSEPFCTSDQLLEQVVHSLEILAVENDAEAESLIAGLAEENSATIEFLLLRTWAANPTSYADDCVRYLASESSRLVGPSFSSHGEGNPHSAVTRDAIRISVPRASADARRLLEEAILAFELPSCQDDLDVWMQRLFLEAFGERYLSAPGQLHLAELRQKFPNQDIEIPARRVAFKGFVGSPIPADQASTLTDDEWLEAMQRYDFGWENRPARRLRSPLEFEGSAVELSRILETKAMEDRPRFAALVHRMGNDLRTEYFDAILSGVLGDGNVREEDRDSALEARRGLNVAAVLGVIRRLHELPGRPCGRAICRAFRLFADRSIPVEDLQILAYYAIEDPDPLPNSVPLADRGADDDADDSFNRGYNSVRGMAAMAIADLLFADWSRSPQLLPVIEQMTRDPSIAVRMCVIEAAGPLLNHDRDQAVELMLAMCDGAEGVMGCHAFERFASFATSTHFPQLRDLLLRGLQSGREPIVKVAGRQICVAALMNEDVESDAAMVRSGDDVMRLAAAEIYSYNLSRDRHRQYCKMHLLDFFIDLSEPVRQEAAKCFRRLGDADFTELEDLVLAYVESPAFPARHEPLLRRLEESSWRQPNVTVRLAERFIKAVGSQASDMATMAAGDAGIVSQLVVRLYAQKSMDEGVRSRCLDLIDEMERLSFLGLDRELAKLDC